MSVKREFISQICCQIIVNKHTLIKDRKNCYKSFLARKYFNFPLFFCFESPADFKLQRSMTQSTNCNSRRALYCQFGQSAKIAQTGNTVIIYSYKSSWLSELPKNPILGKPLCHQNQVLCSTLLGNLCSHSFAAPSSESNLKQNGLVVLDYYHFASLDSLDILCRLSILKVWVADGMGAAIDLRGAARGRHGPWPARGVPNHDAGTGHRHS